MRPTYEAAEQAMWESAQWTPDKPWRVVWGFGAKEDFATLGEAIDKFESIPSGWLPISPHYLPNQHDRCPRSTPGCRKFDCSNFPGGSCTGPDAPRHMDMGR